MNTINNERVNTMMSVYYDLSRDSINAGALGMLLGRHLNRR